MIPLAVCFGAFVLVFLGAQFGSRAGALPALGTLLATVLGLAAGLRYWFPASRWLSQYDTGWTPLHVVIVFWAIFVFVIFVALKARYEYTEHFDPGTPSITARLLGTLFGAGSGLVLATAAMLSVSIVLPGMWPDYKASELPVRIDQWPLTAYRYVETNAARITPTERGHTLLPSLDPKDAAVPQSFWK